MHVDPAHPQIGIWGKKWNLLNSKCKGPFYFLSQPSLNIAVSTYYFLSPPSPSPASRSLAPPWGSVLRAGPQAQRGSVRLDEHDIRWWDRWGASGSEAGRTLASEAGPKHDFKVRAVAESQGSVSSSSDLK